MLRGDGAFKRADCLPVSVTLRGFSVELSETFKEKTGGIYRLLHNNALTVKQGQQRTRTDHNKQTLLSSPIPERYLQLQLYLRACELLNLCTCHSISDFLDFLAQSQTC